MRKSFATCHSGIAGNNSIQASQITLLTRAHEAAIDFTEFAQSQQERAEFSSAVLNVSSQGVLFQLGFFCRRKVKHGSKIWKRHMCILIWNCWESNWIVFYVMLLQWIKINMFLKSKIIALKKKKYLPIFQKSKTKTHLDPEFLIEGLYRQHNSLIPNWVEVLVDYLTFIESFPIQLKFHIWVTCTCDN